MQFIIDDETIKGHGSYIRIMEMISNPNIDVAQDEYFQRVYSGYYFPAQISNDFKEMYFSYMQQCRDECPSFKEIMQYIYNHSGKVHYSFASKLLHTINRDNPILDQYVIRILGFQLMQGKNISKSRPDYQSKKDDDAIKRIDYYNSMFCTVSNEYRHYENEPFMKQAIEKLNALSDEFKSISYMKKVDLLLFRLRRERCVSVLDYLFEAQ